MTVVSALMQYDFGRATGGVRDERHLRIDHLQEEIALSLGEDLDRVLAGELREEMVARMRDRDDHVRRELIRTDERIELLRVHGDRGVSPWRGRRERRVHQARDGVGHLAGRCGSKVREHDDGEAVVGKAHDVQARARNSSSTGRPENSGVR
jgi:hypothetical protein